MIPSQLKSIFSRVLLIALFIFAVVSNVRLIIRNYQVHERIKVAEADVAAAELRNQKLSLLMNYYQSASYQEVEVRRRLGMKKPDEAAYIIKGIDLPTVSSDGDTEVAATSEKSPAQTDQNNVSQWWEYLRGK